VECPLAETSGWSYVDLVAEEQRHTVVAVHPGFDVRRCDAHVVAEVIVEGSDENAVSRAVRRLPSTTLEMRGRRESA